MKRLGYQPALDGLRGVAIAAVVSFHAFGYPRAGYLGVDLFFVLSGFLITTLLLEERISRGRVSLSAFYLRRALRLVPALLVMVAAVVTVALARAAAGTGHGLGETLIGAATGLGYVTNFTLASAGNKVPSLGHLWSLATEEQFYLVWPPLLLLVLRARRAACLTALGLVLGIIVFRQIDLLSVGAPGHRLDFAPDTRGSSIVIGCMVAFTVQAGGRSSSTRLGAWPLFVVGLMLVFDQGRRLYEGPLLLFGLASGLIIVRALVPGTLEHRLLTLSPLVTLGRLSYSLYLWHIPVFVALGVVAEGMPGGGGLPRQLLAVALSLVAATLSYRFVEQPFLRRKRRLGDATPRSPADAPEPAVAVA